MEKKYPTWLLPNLLSLDAPIVAVAWAWMFAQTWRVQWINQNVYYLLPGIVWIIYVFDRFLDNKVSSGQRALKSSRHAFHAKHSRVMQLVAFAVAGFCLALTFQLPLAIFAHAIPVLLMVGIYFFFAIFSETDSHQPQLFKNMIAGYTFSYGVALGSFFFRPSTDWFELIFTQEHLLFGLLCTCNITAIDIWEASRASNEKEVKGVYGFSLTVPLLILVMLSLTLAFIGEIHARPFFLAIMVAAGLLQLINKNRSRFSLNALRTMADLALIVPFPIFWLYLEYLK